MMISAWDGCSPTRMVASNLSSTFRGSVAMVVEETFFTPLEYYTSNGWWLIIMYLGGSLKTSPKTAN